MTDIMPVPADSPDSLALPRERLSEIARSLSIEALSEIEDARGFPILDRDRWEALRESLAVGFLAVLSIGYRRSIQPVVPGDGEDCVVAFARGLRRTVDGTGEVAA